MEQAFTCKICEESVLLSNLGEDDGEGQRCIYCQYGLEEVERMEIANFAQQLGRRGGQKGGKARAAALSPERRSEIAQQAARARWKRR